MGIKPETRDEWPSRTPAPGVGDPARQDDNTSMRDNDGKGHEVRMVSGPNGNQGGN